MNVKSERAHIFREYDIRGVVERDLGDRFVSELGQAIATYIRRRERSEDRPVNLVVGRDCRLSSQGLQEALVKGLEECGAGVIDLGVIPTPLLYFALFGLQEGFPEAREGGMELDGGVMITASHNPPEFNGFKVCAGREAIFGEEIQKLRKLVEARDFCSPRGEKPCRKQEVDIVSLYRDHMLSHIELGGRPLKVAVDAGNGTGGAIAVPIMRALGLTVHDLYCEMDGRFPHHHPDPTEEKNLQDLRAVMRKQGADLGLAYDGDADRIGVLDEQGEVIWGDKLTILFARDILAREPGAAVIGEVKCSQTLFDDVKAKGGRAIMNRVGHSLIKARMKEEGALLAGEMSGHIFFAHRYFGFDDAIYASLRLCEILSRTERPLSRLLDDLPRTYTTPEIRIDCPDERKFDLVAELSDGFRATHQVVDIDGARVQFDGGWGLVRASNTQPALVMRCEAESTARLEEIRDALLTTVRNILEKTS